MKLLPWGNYPLFPQTPQFCNWRADISKYLECISNKKEMTLAYGNGRSYGDSCLATSDHVLGMSKLNKFISADWDKGLVVAEAGVTLHDILRISIPRGWYLSVTPGTKFATLGGAIANDVHGKNHHISGTFGCHLNQFSLLRSDRGRLECSPTRNQDLFAATVGGLGLTGIIEWLEIQLCKIPSSFLDTTIQRFNTLKDFFSISQELDLKNNFGVAWIDCTAKKDATGRGVYIAGNFCQKGKLVVEEPKHLTIPLTLPFSLVNSFSSRIFNTFYWHKHSKDTIYSRMNYESFFYPLDRIIYWNRIYGKKGFQQYQCLIPESQAETAIQKILQTIAHANPAPSLAVIKRFGNIPSPGLLSFPKPGITLAVDFPQTNTLHSELFVKLDSIVHEAGGRLYPAKDAHISAKHFQASYPDWEKVEYLRDPVLLSRFWQRVTSEKYYY